MYRVVRCVKFRACAPTVKFLSMKVTLLTIAAGSPRARKNSRFCGQHRAPHLLPILSPALCTVLNSITADITITRR